MSLHRELRAGGTPFDRTRSLSRGLSGDRCGRVEEVLERVQTPAAARRGSGRESGARAARPGVRRRRAARDQATHEPEPVTLGEDGVHRLRGELGIASTLARAEGTAGWRRSRRPYPGTGRAGSRDGRSTRSWSPARRAIRPGQLHRSRADVRRPDGRVRRRLGDGERDRAGAGPHVDDHAGPASEMVGRADDEARARFPRGHDDRAGDELEPAERGGGRSMSRFFIPENSI